MKLHELGDRPETSFFFDDIVLAAVSRYWCCSCQVFLRTMRGAGRGVENRW